MFHNGQPTCDVVRRNSERMTLYPPLGALGPKASLKVGTLYQGSHDRKWNL